MATNTDAIYNNLVSKYGKSGVDAAVNAVKSGTTDKSAIKSIVTGGSTTTDTTTPTTPTTTTTDTGNTTPPATPTTDTNTKTTGLGSQETTGSTNTKVKQEGSLTPLSQDYYNQTSDDAQNKIISNLNTYEQSNPELFSSYDSFQKNFSYNARNQEQKQTLDDRWNGRQNGLKWSNTSVSDLYNSYNAGELSDADLQTLNKYNSAKYSELQAAIDRGNIISSYDDDSDTSEMSFQDMASQYLKQAFTNFINGTSDSESSKIFETYENNMNSEEMQGYQTELAEKQEEIDNIEDQISEIKKSVEEEYEGTGATSSKINAIISDRTYDLQMQLRTLNNSYNKTATLYNNKATQYQNEYQLQLQEYQLQMSEKSQQMSELGFAMNLINFETNDQAQEREWNYRVKQQEYTNGNVNSSDPEIQLKAIQTSVDNLLANYSGIPTIRSNVEIAEDIQKAIQNGSTLGEELTKLNKDMQSKDEYKILYNKTYGSSVSTPTSFTVGDESYVVYNGQIITADQWNSMFSGSNNGSYSGNNLTANPVSSDTVSSGLSSFESTMASYKGKTYKTGQCGELVNSYLSNIGSSVHYGNDLSDKTNSINSYTPTVGSVAIWDGSTLNTENGKTYGHVAIVTGVNSDGSITVLEQNGDLKNPKTVGSRTISASSVSKISGYYNPTQGLSKGTSSSSDYSTTDPYSGISGYTKKGQEINSGGWISSLEDQYTKDWASNDERNSTLKAYGLTLDQYNEQKQRYVDYSANVTLKEEAQKMYDAIDDLLTWNKEESSSGLWSRHSGITDRNTYNIINGTAGSDLRTSVLGYDDTTANGINKYNYVKNNLLLDTYQDLKKAGASFGAMQQSEWNLVGSAASKLNWMSSDEEFESILQEMKDGYANILGINQSSTQQSQPDMSSMQSNSTMSYRSNNGKIEVSYDGGKTWQVFRS